MRRVAVTLVAAGALLFSFTAGLDPVAARADETLPEASSEASVEELPDTSGLVTSENDEVEASDEVKPEAEVEGEAELEAETETETEPEPEAEPEAGSETETVPDPETSETDAEKDDAAAPETSAESEGTEDTENAEDAEGAEDEGVDLLAEEAEKERIRAERRAANPDGITENTSKKKQERKEREEREAAQREFAAKKAGIDLEAQKAIDFEKCPSGIPDRPYCRGRAYDPNRYKGKAPDSTEAE